MTKAYRQSGAWRGTTTGQCNAYTTKHPHTLSEMITYSKSSNDLMKSRSDWRPAGLRLSIQKRPEAQ